MTKALKNNLKRENGSLVQTTICLCNRLCDEKACGQQTFAVGVSGGADSLALVYLLREWALRCGKKIVALTVDHQLRPTSRQEADYVAKLMRQAGIEHHILTWEGEKPVSGIETAAREARYRLLEDWCLSNGICTIFMAHHKRDQAETFFIRLQRGSGLDGLCGIAPASSVGRLTVLRPLLDIAPEALRDYLNAANIRWVEDESNQCDDYLRVRVRKLLPQLAEVLGLSEERIVDTMATLRRSKAYLDEQTERIVKNQVQYFSDDVVAVSAGELLKLHQEMRFRLMARLLKQISGRVYPPRADDLENLCCRMEDAAFKSATLGGCEVCFRNGRFWIFREEKMAKSLSREQWRSFCEAYPRLKRMNIPARARRQLYWGLLNGKNLYIKS
ncbi:MAG: tRNA lysidine(34) synthetase TilS [Alphaproteobacteria bacterium]|jgi:tRNA(ile)-lysidine synthetase|nr:tRNA lysidine(34) synthetase TilS [Alphaproteobacteria bacterium]